MRFIDGITGHKRKVSLKTFLVYFNFIRSSFVILRFDPNT
jgi:hypothetical protein